MLDVTQSLANAIDAVEVILGCADHGCPRVLDDIGEVIGGQPVVDRHQHRADLGHGVKRLELLVDVRGDVCDSVALANAHPLERGGPAVAAVEELLVGKPEVAVDDRLTLWMQASSPAYELEWRERCLHRVLPPPVPALRRV